MPWMYVDQRGTENVLTSVTVPRHLHTFAREEKIGLSRTLREALETRYRETIRKTEAKQ